MKKQQLLLVLLLCLSGFMSEAQYKSEPIQTLKGAMIPREQLEAFLLQKMDSLDIPGLSIALIENNEIAYTNVFGVSNLETGEKVDQNTIFEAASLSKPVFAYLVMKMVEKGLLDLDKPMYTYLPHPGIAENSQEWYRLVTPRMILSHSSGFPNWSNNQKIEIAFEPGTDFSYSGEAYQYLAAVIGQLNGVGWEDDLNQVFLDEVAKPLGMQHTSFTWTDYIEAHKATGHQDGKVTDKLEHGKSFGAGYSLHSEAGDYARFLVAMLQQKGLQKELFEEMFKEQNHFKEDNPIRQETGQTGWSLGFARKPTDNGMMYLHTGNNHDFQAYCMILPEMDYGLVLFTNSDKMEALLKSLPELLGPIF